MVQIGACLAVTAAVALLTGWLVRALLLGVLIGWAGTAFYLRRRQNKRTRRFADDLPDTLQLVASSLRTGFSLPQALDSAQDGAADPMASELGRALAATRIGSGLEDELERVADRMRSEDWRWAVMAVRIQRDVGGNLAEVLMTTVTTLRERAATRRQVRALSAEGRLSAWILLALPIGLFALLLVIRTEYLSLLVDHPARRGHARRHRPPHGRRRLLDEPSGEGGRMNPAIVLVVAVGATSLASLLLVGAFALRSTGKTGVARSLELIEHVRVRHEMAPQDLPARERLVDPALPRRAAARPEAHSLRAAGASPAPARHRRQPRRVDPRAGARHQGRRTRDRGRARGAHAAANRVVPRARVGGRSGRRRSWLPDLLLYNAGLKRQQALQRSTPDALDMLTVCVEAGLGFDAALSHVARNTRGPITGEFARILQEMQIGKSRTEAFQALAERTTVPELHTLVSALVQADNLGIPVANVLRSQSHEMRVKRRQRAEEQAQKIPVKILFPLIFCVFPALFVVILGPAGIQIASTFLGG